MCGDMEDAELRGAIYILKDEQHWARYSASQGPQCCLSCYIYINLKRSALFKVYFVVFFLEALSGLMYTRYYMARSIIYQGH